jgi:tetratricopeptide (TPR) repeat protein
MKTSHHLAILLIATVGPRVVSARQSNQPPPAKQRTATPPAKSVSPDEASKHADIYYDFTLGHYYQQRYELTRLGEDASRAIEFFKKAYALDPASQQIGEELADIYFQSQRVRDAVAEAQPILAKDPNNLPARRLLARIYVRILGDLSNTSGQRDTLALAAEQYREIARLDPTDTDAALWLARLYRLLNEHDKAETVLRGLLARVPEDENATGLLSQLLLDEGKQQEAISLLKGIVERAPTARLWNLLGSAYAQTQDFTNAEQAFRKAAEVQPGDISHRRGLAQALLSEEKYGEALEQYQRLVEMDADDANNYLRLAEIYRQMKQLDKAEQNVLLAKQLAPGNLEVIYYESSIYEDEGRFEDSIRVLSDAVASVKAESEFSPSRRRTLAILYQQLGELYREVNNYVAAVNTFEEMLRLGPEEELRARVMIIETYRAARDIPKALDASRRAIEAYPKDRSIRTLQALLYGENAQTDQAVLQLRQLLDGTTADFDIQLELAQVYEQGRRWPEAEQAVQAAEKIGGQPSQKEMTSFLLGAIFERQKKLDLAEEQFRQVLKENPRNPSTLNYYGYMLADLGVRLDEAADLIERALAEDPANPAYQDSLGWAYFKQNKYPEAEDLLRKAVSRDSHDPTILSHLGDLYSKIGKDDLAESYWQKSLDEWHRVLPGQFEPDKFEEVEQKVSALKHRLAQQNKLPGDAKP